MSRFRNSLTNVVVSVDDAKDDRFAGGEWTRLDADETGEPEHPSGGETPTPPPLGGKGSGESEWRAYAEKVGVDVTDAENRDAIVEALRAAGKPVEPEQE